MRNDLFPSWYCLSKFCSSFRGTFLLQDILFFPLKKSANFWLKLFMFEFLFR